MRIILTGATGLTGMATLDRLLITPLVTQATVITRRPFTPRFPDHHHRLKLHFLDDFLDYSKILPDLGGHDACLWCLGLSQRGVTPAEYERATYDYAVAGAKAMFSVNPRMRFAFLSGQGADSTEKSRLLFARVKGRTENALLKLSPHVVCFRPGYIHPSIPRDKPRIEERIAPFLLPLFELLFPSTFILSYNLALALVYFAKFGLDVPGPLRGMKDNPRILENLAIRDLAQWAD